MFTFIILFVFLSGVSVIGIAIAWNSALQSRYKLQRKAQSGDKQARRLFALNGMRYRLQSTLSIIVAVALTAVISLLDSKIDGPLMLILGAIVLLGCGLLLPLKFQSNATHWTAKLDPLLTKLMSVMSPFNKHLSGFLERHDVLTQVKHATKKELQDMLESKDLTVGSDISAEEARMLRKVLTFSERRIRDIMTPRRVVRTVSATDELGPILLDELHTSGHSRFPVTDGDTQHIHFVGTLFIRDLALHKKVHAVSEVMSPDVIYIHEDETVDKALRAFLRTKHHLFIVVNNFQEFVGVLSIEDVLEEIIGKEIIDESDTVADLREAAKQQADVDVKERANKLKP